MAIPRTSSSSARRVPTPTPPPPPPPGPGGAAGARAAPAPATERVTVERGRSALAGRPDALAALRERVRKGDVGAGVEAAVARGLNPWGGPRIPGRALDLTPGLPMGMPTPRATGGPSASQIAATMERLNHAPVEVTVQEATALLRSMGFKGDLLEQVQRAGYRFREMTPGEVAKGRGDDLRGQTYEHDIDTRPVTSVDGNAPSLPGPPTITLNPGVLVDLRMFVATGGRGLDGVSGQAPPLGSGTPLAIRKALATLNHEMTHARLHGVIASAQPWVTQELARIQQEHHVSEAVAKDILQEVCGYYVSGHTEDWARTAIDIQRGDDPAEARKHHAMLRGHRLAHATDATVGRTKVEHTLSPEAQRELESVMRSLAEGPGRAPRTP